MNSPSLGEDVPHEQALITGLSRIQDGVRFNFGMVLALAADKNKAVFTCSPSTIRQGLGHCLLWTNVYGRYFFWSSVLSGSRLCKECAHDRNLRKCNYLTLQLGNTSNLFGGGEGNVNRLLVIYACA